MKSKQTNKKLVFTFLTIIAVSIATGLTFLENQIVQNLKEKQTKYRLDYIENSGDTLDKFEPYEIELNMYNKKKDTEDTIGGTVLEDLISYQTGNYNE